MKAVSASITQLMLPLVATTVALTIGIGVAVWLPNIDNDLFTQMVTTFCGPHARTASTVSVLHESVLPLLANCVLTLFFTITAAFAGYKLGPRASLAALLQLCVLWLLLQWLLWNWYALRFYPLALLTATTTALIGAKLLRMLVRHKSNAQTRHYELMLRNMELKEAKLQMVRKDEMERRWLAADLHDAVLNDLKAARQNFTVYQAQPSESAAQKIDKLLAQAMEEVREVMDSLSPSVLQHLGLIAAVDECLRRACGAQGFKRRFNCQLEEADLSILSTTQQTLLYRLIQESVTNACKHSCGKMLQVDMERFNGELVVRITDDGKGVGVAALMNASTLHRNGTYGVRYMRQRADLIGARISWRAGSSESDSSNRPGTVVEIRLPVSTR